MSLLEAHAMQALKKVWQSLLLMLLACMSGYIAAWLLIAICDTSHVIAQD